MPLVDVAMPSGNYIGIEVPEECTVGRWKALLESGALGDKILYAKRLSCLKEEKGAALEESATLPNQPDPFWISGPGSVVAMLDLLLKKKVGPAKSRSLPDTSNGGGVSKSASTWRPSGNSGVPRVTQQAGQGTMQKLSAEKLAGSGFAGAFAGLNLNNGTSMPLHTTHKDAWIECVCSGLQGRRPHMEDRTCAVLELVEAKQLGEGRHASLFGVFDGHGGQQVSEACAQKLPGILAEELISAGWSGAEQALNAAFARLDEVLRTVGGNFKAPGGASHPYDWIGSTGVVMLLLREPAGAPGKRVRVFCANVGDSRAVLCRGRNARDLSHDQKPQNSPERERIEAAGGRVTLFGPCWRIDAGLNLSRAFGDFAYKTRHDLPLDRQKVIAVPEILVEELGEADEFIVAGSDGIFDVLSSEALVQQMREAAERGDTMEAAVQRTLEDCIRGGDNVTLCYVRFLSGL
eukprot:gnl/TRDRNA2_/TRDRNA2_30523_c0_seq1.p1 gnl/TRDRNA2_/TRDRNA2_30523_c0~~gnl/TRDRNA2_/TRDRNA2_30523_c0_seq1.p1  ORF type:complete len:463 (+),score=93.37 gnl/TRDRNA2_/TRDRNA2_30523_c0_seq1:146-1534(+)